MNQNIGKDKYEINYEIGNSRIHTSENHNLLLNTTFDMDLNTVNQKDMLIDFIDQKGNQDILNKSNWKQWFKNPENLYIDFENLPKAIFDKVSDKNKTIEKHIHNVENSLDFLKITKNEFHIDYIEWDWILCYGKHNFFDFKNTNNKSTLISGLNGVGKSSFNEVICISLFGQTSPSKTNSTKSGNLICTSKPINEQSKSHIIFTFNNDSIYKLSREFRYQADGIKLHKSSVKLYIKDNTENDEFSLFKSGPCVEQWILQNIGKLEYFLLSSMMSQNYDHDFFDKKSQEQFDILDNSLNITSLNNIVQMYKQITLV